MTLRLWLLVLAVVCAACGSDTRDPLFAGDRGPDRPEPAQPSAAPVVAHLAVGETTFLLHDEGEGCLALEIRHPGLQSTVSRRCFEREVVLAESGRCGWLEDPEAAAGPVLALSIRQECDVDLPGVLFGKLVEPNIEYVCLGTMVDEESPEVTVTGARFLTPDPVGYILEPVRENEVSEAHLFTADGLRYGSPPLDAPSAPIYEACEELAPWGATGTEYAVVLLISVGVEPEPGDTVLFFDTGLDAVGVAPEAFNELDVIDLPGRVGASSTGLTIGFEVGSGRFATAPYEWPAGLEAILRSGRPCNAPIFVEVIVGPGFGRGEPDAVSLTMQPTTCEP